MIAERFSEVILEKRDCDVCGSQDLESLWQYEKNICINGSTKGYSFKVNNVICRSCGFTFCSPRFNEDVLADYYGSSLRNPLDQPLDYDISFRMDVINRFLPKGVKPKFIEIGPSAFCEFQERVGKYFSYRGIEPSGAFGSEWKNVQDFKETSLADIVAHYFVLEHIPNPLKFLKECNRLLKMNGIMIVEVPNIAIYPADPVALHLYEHQSHFSLRTLECLASKVGFVQIECTDKSSRSFGMTAVFRKIMDSPTEPLLNIKKTSCQNIAAFQGHAAIPEYQMNKQFFNLGLIKVKNFEDSLSQAKNFIENAWTEVVILWGANQNLVDFLEHAYPKSNAPNFLTFIDSDSRKRNLLLNYGRFDKMVFTPSECIDAIKKSCRLIVFTRRHKQAILDSIISLTGKRYKDEDTLTVDINP